ncbi:MAG: sensor histidine kinase, partial [Notoacmeibacter sp.]
CELAHELRTPLAAIVGFAEALSQTESCTNQMRESYPALIAATGRALIEMTSSMLEPQPDDAPKQSGKLANVVHDCLVVMQPLANQKSIVIFNRIPALFGEKLVECVSIRQILTNLISNAIKFSPVGASIEISAATAANGWTLKVTDNGVGLSPEDVARLGQKNFRGDSSVGIAGHGLGLSIVKRLVETIGARVSFESRPGKGTQVTLTFPASPLVELAGFHQPRQNDKPTHLTFGIITGEKHAAA